MYKWYSTTNLMSSVLICHNLGLGDHFMCHGIVRNYAKKYDRVGLFVKPHNITSVAFMYRDLPNLKIHVGHDEDMWQYVLRNKCKFGPFWNERYDNTRIIGFTKLSHSSGEQIEHQFYRLAGIPLGQIWDGFYVERDLVREQTFEQQLSLAAPYAFVHDDDRYTIDTARSGALPVVRANPTLTQNVFDYCGVIERANEIHVIDSSFMFLIDQLPYTNVAQRLFIHRYARPNPVWTLPILKKNWTLLT